MLEQPVVNALVGIGGARRADVIFALIGPYPFVRLVEGERTHEFLFLRAGHFARREPERLRRCHVWHACRIDRPQRRPEIRLLECKIKHAVAAVAEAGEIQALSTA